MLPVELWAPFTVLAVTVLILQVVLSVLVVFRITCRQNEKIRVVKVGVLPVPKGRGASAFEDCPVAIVLDPN